MSTRNGMLYGTAPYNNCLKIVTIRSQCVHCRNPWDIRERARYEQVKSAWCLSTHRNSVRLANCPGPLAKVMRHFTGKFHMGHGHVARKTWQLWPCWLANYLKVQSSHAGFFFLNAWELWSYPLVMVIHHTKIGYPVPSHDLIIMSMKLPLGFSSCSHKIRGNYTIYLQVVGSIPMSIPVYSIMYVLKWHRLYPFIRIFPSYPMICIMKW